MTRFQSNLRADIRSAVGDGDHEIFISNVDEWGRHYDHYQGEDGRWGPGLTLPYQGRISECPAEILDHTFDADYGSPDRPMWLAWTSARVGYGTEYDGSTGSAFVPRHPPQR